MKKSCILVALSAAIIIGAGMRAHAQGGINVPPGQLIVCTLHCHGLIFIRHADGSITEVPEDARGSATFQSNGGNNLRGGDDPTTCSFTPVSMTLSGDDATYGHFSFTFDAARIPTNTTVTANQVGTDFPATADVYANVTGTISSIPGNFTNTTECHMQTTNLQSFNPNVNEVYTFVNDVDFANDAGDATTFTIPAGSTVELN